MIFQSLGDLNQPYSCSQWGNVASQGIPLITDDTGMSMFNLFNTENLLPSSIFIDHTMTIQYKYAGHDGEVAINEKIQDMLDNLYGAPVMAAIPEISFDNENDNDGVLNPGEGFSASYVLTNNSFETNILNASASLLVDSGGSITSQSTIFLGNIDLGQSVYANYSVLLDELVQFGDYNLDLSISAEYINSFGEISVFNKNIYSSINVSLNQSGFPISTSELRSSPLVIDLDNDGDNEIIIGDNNGYINVYDHNGNEINNDTFPFDTGNQIWGSAAAADMDGDGLVDFVINSKSKHLYIFDINGLKTDYNANKYLMGTPAIGNIDDDDDLEVVIGGYSSPASSNPIFAINLDGTDVEGFPLVIGEKTKEGPALADFNNNGKDDIVIGTDDDNVYLIYDDGTIAPGFPYTANDKIQAPPTIIDLDGDKNIFIGSNDNNLYAINGDGSLKFKINTGDKVQSSVAFVNYNDNQYIFFGSNNDMIFAVDFNGNALEGWPIAINGTIGGSVVFSDLNNDNSPNIVATTDMGEIIALNMDGTYLEYFPISNNFPSVGSPMVIDLDGDNDLEIMGGSGSNLFVIDVKSFGDVNEYWNLYRGNIERNGCRFFSLNSDSCDVEIGDLNGDININILDIVILANCILDQNCLVLSNGCAGDLNNDQAYNILDIVNLANIILD